MTIALITNYNINEKANAAMTVAERLIKHDAKILIPGNFRERIERMHKHRPYIRFESQQNVYNLADMIIVLVGDGTVSVEAGQFVYIYCSVNEFTADAPDENAKHNITQK